MKYELGYKHPIENLYPIIALKDFGDVKEGDVGGWVESENNLSQEGNCWIYDDAVVCASAKVLDDAKVMENAKVHGSAIVRDSSVISDNALVFDNAEIYGHARVYGYARVRENACLIDHARVYGDADISGNVHLFDRCRVYEDAKVYGDACVYGYAEVYGWSEIFGHAEVYGDSQIFGGTQVCNKTLICNNIVVNPHEKNNQGKKMTKKYQLGDKHPEYLQWRVVALKDFGDVKAGDVGGWIESERNLSQEGNCWIFDDAAVWGDARVYDNAQIYGNAQVCGKARVFDDARVYDNAQVYNMAEVYGNAQVYEDAQIYDDAHVFSDCWIYGRARVYDNALVYGNARVFDDAWVYDSARVFDDARVFDEAQVYDGARVYGDANVGGNSRVYSTVSANEDTTEITGGTKSKMTKGQWTAKVVESSDGDSVLEFPDELVAQVGWCEGDEVEWHDNGDGTYTLTKATKPDTEWVLVSAISTYRMRYLVEVPKGKSEYALDTVTFEDAKEFDQEWLGETITEHRVVTEQQALDLFRNSNDIFAQWDDDVIKENHFTFWVEE